MSSEAVFSLDHGSPNHPLAGLGSEPLDADIADDLLFEGESDAFITEYALDEDYLEPPRVHVPKPLVWGFLVLLSLAAIALMVWGFTQSTWTYSTTTVEPATSARLAQVREQLAAAGAPEAALHRIDIAAQPGINTGDALEALIIADKLLRPMSEEASIASALQELHAILNDLDCKRYRTDESCTLPAATISPGPTLIIPTP